VEDDLAAAALEPVLAIVGRHEPLESRTIGDVVTGPDDRNPFGSEDLDDCLSVLGTKCRDERLDGIVQRLEALLPGRGEDVALQADHERERDAQGFHRRPPPLEPPPPPPPPPPL